MKLKLFLSCFVFICLFLPFNLQAKNTADDPYESKISESSYNGKTQYHATVRNKNSEKSNHYVMISFSYIKNYYNLFRGIKEIDLDGDGWIKAKEMWTQFRDHIWISETIESSDVSFEEIPGKPIGLSLAGWPEIQISFNKNEEFAEAFFTNEADARRWADNIIKLFKENQHLQRV